MKTTDALIQLLTDAATLERSAAVRLGHRLHESDSSLIHTQTRADYAENLLAQAKDLVDYLESKTSAPA